MGWDTFWAIFSDTHLVTLEFIYKNGEPQAGFG
jgi:hypothetical protein